MNKFIGNSILGGLLLLLIFLVAGNQILLANRDSLVTLLQSDTISIENKIELAQHIGRSFKWQEGCVPYFKKMKSWSEAANDVKKTAVACEYLATYYFYNAQLDSSEYFYREALGIYEEIEDLVNVAKMYNNAGLSLHRKGEYVMALKDYQEALKIYEKIPDSAATGSTLNRIGGIYRDQKKLELALPYYARSLAIAEQTGDVKGLADALGNQGVVFQQLDSVNLAIRKYEQVLSLSREHSLVKRINTCLISLGTLHLKKGEYGIAKSLLLEAQKTEKNRSRLTTIEINLGKIARQLGKADNAIVHLDRALSMAENSGNKDHQKGALLELINAHLQLGNSNEARQYFVKYDAIKDSLYQLSNIREITQLEMQYAFDREKEQAWLIEERRAARQRIILSGLIVGLFAIATIAYLIFRSARSRRKMNRILEEKNQTIQKALEEKELLLREIHHRVKNNLQVISNLLYLQSEYNTDDSVARALQEGRNRVKSMALIHKNLYQEDNLTGIEIRDYFEKLAKSLFDSYRIDKSHISLKTEIDPIRLDVDTVIPLALIINELMTNSLEHAFSKNESGEITVKLKELNNQLFLSISDNGIGLPSDFNFEKSDSFGFEMVRLFAQKLNASVDFHNEEGLNVDLTIKNYQRA